jgi:hypothetical protein
MTCYLTENFDEAHSIIPKHLACYPLLDTPNTLADVNLPFCPVLPTLPEDFIPDLSDDMKESLDPEELLAYNIYRASAIVQASFGWQHMIG